MHVLKQFPVLVRKRNTTFIKHKKYTHNLLNIYTQYRSIIYVEFHSSHYGWIRHNTYLMPTLPLLTLFAKRALTFYEIKCLFEYRIIFLDVLSSLFIASYTNNDIISCTEQHAVCNVSETNSAKFCLVSISK